ncbi:putative hydrolase YxeP [Novipirellula galeiformis]|uniref:Putative hydrolase YxeP n=2 Tax=Novipirellula galeiformis TaxID=2528004 RepID=A0A5C6BZ01_9BACT|nr:putative hydrolase YxeP [Novipirellula galeiformis]
MRRHLHAHPELSDAEFQTTEYLTRAFAQLGLPTHVPIEGRGLTADLVTFEQAPDHWIAIRGDIDALPITDSKAVAYRSRCEGVMHACGHDVHASVVFAAIQILSSMQAANGLPWPIAVRALLQPSEELATGARYMIHNHALRDIDAILALHVDPTRSVGCIGFRHGTLTAACDALRVGFHGNGGHGARPHLTNDPVDAMTHWVQSAFRRLGRTVNAHQTVVFSIGQMEAGHSPNVIPDSASLAGSLRSLDAQARRVALETLEDVCEAIEVESGCKVEMTLGFSAPAVVNSTPLVDLLSTSATQLFTAGAVEWIDEPSMGSEDFSYYLEHVPGAMFRLGVAGEQVGHAPLHTPAFDIDERAILVGAKLFAAAVIAYFDPEHAKVDTEAR